MSRAVVLALISFLIACGGAPAARTPEPAPPAAAKPTPQPEGEPAVGTVLLASAEMIDADAFAAAYARLATDGPAMTDVTSKDGTLSFQLGDSIGSLGLMPAPVPNGEAEYKAQFSLEHLSEGWTPKPHTAHLLLLMISRGRTKVEAYLDYSRVLAAAAEVSPSVGVFLGHVTHDVELFRAAIVADEPLAVWTGINIADLDETAADRLSVLSLGMEHIGLMNLRVTGPRATVLERFYELLMAQFMRGSPFPDGDTIGRDASERLTIVYEPSPIDPEITVWHVTLP